jgi:hypothetical protein
MPHPVSAISRHPPSGARAREVTDGVRIPDRLLIH